MLFYCECFLTITTLLAANNLSDTDNYVNSIFLNETYLTIGQRQIISKCLQAIWSGL